VQGPGKICQAADALEIHVATEIALDDETLGRAADDGFPLEIAQFEVVSDLNLVELEGESVTVADFLVDKETDIDAKWFAWVRHRERRRKNSGFRIRKPVSSL
jgi:hypothetical protein